MMRRYQSFIHHTAFFCAALLLSGCTSEESLSDGTLSGDGKTPLRIEASLDTGRALTRAAGKDFAPNDILLAYIRHLNESGVSIPVDKAPLLVAFKKGNAAMEVYDANTNQTSDLTSVNPTATSTAVPLYWDDFSVGQKNDATDIRTDGHGLQSYYGYCYNGGTPSTALTEATGTLGWTLPTSYANAAAVMNADLLWSATQEKLTYAHASARTGEHGTLSIPYTHAMSEITVTLTAGEGFSGDPLGSTVLTLNAMSTVTNLTAPTSTATAVPGDGNANIKSITMFAEDYSTGLTRNFTAIVGPGTKLKVGEQLLNITNVENNDYTLEVTDAMVKKDDDADDSNNAAWAKDHAVGTESGKDYITTKPGYNYHLAVTVNKTAIKVEATLTDWTAVNATGTGVITYPSVDFSLSGLPFADEAEIHIFRILANNPDGSVKDDRDTPAERNTMYGSKATTATYNSSTGKWTNAPLLYWDNQNDKYYFRGLSQTETSVTQDSDVLWGTTPAHATYAVGDAIAPRTNEVPLLFEHAMSKVSFVLETTAGEVSSTTSPVNLTDATIAISNLSTSGTIHIEDGSIDEDPILAGGISAMTEAQFTNYAVIPQTITDDAMIIVTLDDGTTYRLQLNQCKDASDNIIDTWERGKSYTYTIHLEKEQIQFRALIKDWEPKTGSGNANLEWD